MIQRDEIDGRILDRLTRVIESRRGDDPEASYTAKLLQDGRGKIAQKLGEEAVETIIASLDESPEAVTNESADLLYHLLVLWAEKGIAPKTVWAELGRRFGVSGIKEKHSRVDKP
jgi:phosphoribosyl-ATP pyrophosphohydrolase